ncbi:MAG: flagellar filament capping protein FliD [Thermodesulfobacteriota bacterium]|nr:flagellar filament capping protein FliD [Thermodesulfobacteriota bacterium]
MAGSISTLGIGSGLQLQDIIDQLREVDNLIVTRKEDQITDLEEQYSEFNAVKNKLLTLKSYALDLSLSTTFLSRSVTSSDEKVFTATVTDGATVQSSSLNVTGIAARSSWKSSSGMSSEDSIVYVPTSVQSATGTADHAAAGYINTTEDLVITFGTGASQQTITVGVTNGMSMDQVINAINTDAENQDPGGPGANGRYVTAEWFEMDGEDYLRVQTDTVGGTGEDNRVTISTQLSDVTLQAPNKTFAYNVDDTTVTLSVAADTTLSGLADLINDDTNNPGVTATVIDDGDSTNPYRIVLQSDASGEDNRISFLAQLPDMVMAEQQGAGGESLNARFSIDGIDYQRQSNTITDVMSGVSLALIGAGSATATVSSNDTELADKITNFITAYNDAVAEIESNVAWDEETEGVGILARTTLRDLTYDLHNLMTSTIVVDSTGKVQSMFDLGMEYGKGGIAFDESGNEIELPTISIDSDTLAGAIADNATTVQSFFLGDDTNGITGFADMVNDRLRTLTTGNGQIEAEKSGAQERISQLELQIESETDRLNKKYELMTKQFIELDRYMNQMTSISSYLTNQFSSLSKGWGGTGSSSN